MRAAIFTLVMSVAMLALVLVYAATFHAIARSQDRTACYHAGHADCGERDAIERAVAWFLNDQPKEAK